MHSWMKWVIGYYSVSTIVLVVIIILSVKYWDKRYKKRESSEIPAGFIKTDEICIDPETGNKQRVYYNPESGERIYVNEKVLF